jgi:hypothetical protein
MKIARPGLFTVNNVTIPREYILGYQENSDTFLINNHLDHCFTTNYLGCIIGLFNELKDRINESTLNKLELSISVLKMLWDDNLMSIHIDTPSDRFWHRRNTQYVQGKQVMINLITAILESGVSYYFDSNSQFSQRFRDALMLSSHMQSLNQNIEKFHFVDINK